MGLEDELKVLIISELKVADIKPEELDNNASLFGDGMGLDSLDAVELVVILKRKYDIEIKDKNEAEAAFASINTLVDFIREHRVVNE